jgi:hypothetical protein
MVTNLVNVVKIVHESKHTYLDILVTQYKLPYGTCAQHYDTLMRLNHDIYMAGREDGLLEGHNVRFVESEISNPVLRHPCMGQAQLGAARHTGRE